MKFQVSHEGQILEGDFSAPLDISLRIRGDIKNVSAWSQPPPKIVPITGEDWVGKVSSGGAVNFNQISFSPHSHGTHTESVGHISAEAFGVDLCLNTYFFMAQLISLEPASVGEDSCITKEQLQRLVTGKEKALIIRTLPNSIAKRSAQYTGTNWPYLQEEAAIYLREYGIEHLLVDMPSVDKEKDGGKLLAHKAFWNFPKNTREHATITELIYVPAKILDGTYLLNLQTSSFENDAVPSRPVLYRVKILQDK